MKHQTFFLTLACALLACAPAAIARKPPPSSHPANLEQAVKQVQQQTNGHILAADTVSRGRANVYRIKVLTPKGQVRVMQLQSKPQPAPRPAREESEQGGH